MGGHVRALELGDMSPGRKAAMCRRTPNYGTPWLAVRLEKLLNFSQVHEVLQQLQPDFLAFFRVKLRGENIVAPDG